jgi:hypothetical protein
MTETWTPVEAPIDEILTQYPEPLLALARGEVPAFVLRRFFNPAHCQALMQRFYERGLLYDPHTVGDGTSRRVDIGTSFGQHHRDREHFHAHSAETIELFNTLFDGYDDPVRALYDALARLTPNKDVKTAREPDGRLYGPAIFRVYHSEVGHGPHYDSVAKRTQAFEYQIARFEHQFAGVLCFQNSNKEGGTGEPYLYNCPFRPEVKEHLSREHFPGYVERENIERIQVQLEPGDLYFFFTENIHEVPAIVGDQPRAVLAIFFAMSPDDDEIYVWA